MVNNADTPSSDSQNPTGQETAADSIEPAADTITSSCSVSKNQLPAEPPPALFAEGFEPATIKESLSVPQLSPDPGLVQEPDYDTLRLVTSDLLILFKNNKAAVQCNWPIWTCISVLTVVHQ